MNELNTVLCLGILSMGTFVIVWDFWKAIEEIIERIKQKKKKGCKK